METVPVLIVSLHRAVRGMAVCLVLAEGRRAHRINETQLPPMAVPARQRLRWHDCRTWVNQRPKFPMPRPRSPGPLFCALCSAVIALQHAVLTGARLGCRSRSAKGGNFAMAATDARPRVLS